MSINNLVLTVTGGAHPAIIEADLFARVQARARRSEEQSGPTAGKALRTGGWLLHGFAVCALCGVQVGAAYGKGPRDNY